MKNIVINPVTRIEGHGKITIELDEKGNVKDARYCTVYVRGFEKFLEGCAIEDLPKFTPRICGVCPISHHLCSAKACDDLFNVKIPVTAKKVRLLHNYLGLIHSHTAHICVLAGPDLLLPDADQKTRNVFGLAAKNLDLVKKVIELRKFGQEGSRILMGRAIHPYTAVPGGIAHQVTEEMVNEIKELGRNSMEIVEVIVDAVRKVTMDLVENKKDLLDKLGNIETGYLGVVKDDGTTDFYDGKIRYMSKDGKITDFEAKDYLNYIAETTMDWSYVKAPYWKEFGFPAGIMKVGPLARLNVIEKLGTPKADELLKEYREIVGRPAHITMLYHYARAIELMNCTEKALELLDDSDITGKDRFADVPEPGAGEGIAIIEAQRGTLLHHYKTDENGFLSDCSMIVSTTFNNPAIDQSIKIAAKNLINSSSADEKILNTIEMVQRAYDPCLSCAAHSLDGRFPTVVEILDSEGNRIREIKNF